MARQQFRVTINGFTCNSESRDNLFEIDGKRDEVFIAVGTKLVDRHGTVFESREPVRGPILGDTWRLPNRIKAGSAAGGYGGILTGDSYPTRSPWIRSLPLQDDRNWPPYKIWEGELVEGETTAFITPTIWEWDGGTSVFEGLLDWHRRTDAQFGKQAKEAFGKIWPVVNPIFDAVSVGIQTAATIPGIWGAAKDVDRPVGLLRDTSKPDGILFNPQTLALTYEMAISLTRVNPHGYGLGVLPISYSDDPWLAGSYTLYLQIEALGHADLDYPDLNIVREVSRPEVYVVAGGAKFQIPDPPTLFRLYGGWEVVRIVPDQALAQLAAVPREGTLIREENDPRVWRIEGQTKRHITTPEVLARYGGWLMVRVLPDRALARLPPGAPIV
jgi:hypothetical protein